MDRLRLLILAIAATLWACHGHAPTPVHQDAGAPTHAPDAGAPPVQHAPEPDPASAMAKSDAGTRVPPQRHKPRTLAAADPRVLECVDRPYSDWPSVRDCIAAEAPEAVANAADAGRKLGAIARPNVAFNPAWLVPAWYVNATTGNDANTCVTSGAPCKTWGEIVNRWQTDAPWLTTVVTVTIEAANMPVTDYIHWRPVVTNTGAAIIVGTDTTVATVSLGSVVSKNRSAVGAYPTGALTANLGGSAAQGLRLVNHTHPSVAWIDSVSGSVSTITQPMSENVGAWTVPTEVDAWANGDSVTIASPVKAYVSSFDPTPATSGSFGADDFVGGFIGDIWSLDPTTTSFPSNVTFGHLVMVSEVRADPYVLVTGPTEAVISTTHVNCFFPYGGALFGSSLLGGSMDALGGTGIAWSGQLDGDIIIHGNVAAVNGSSAGTTVNEMGDVFFANSDVEILGDTDFDAIYYGVGLYGTYTLGFDSSAGGRYTPPAASTFLGSAVSGGLLTFGQSPGAAFANAYDTSVTPAQWYPARAITPALLDTAISSGGFSGRAYGDTGAVLAPYSQSTAAPAAYVTPVPNGGLGTGTICGAGQCATSNGSNAYSGCATPGAVSSVTGAGTVSCSPTTGAVTCTGTNAVSSVSGSSGVSCSPTTGAVNCTNTGVTSVTGGTGISCSPTTGAATCTNTGATTVTGAGSTSCSPTSGAVTCTTSNTVANGLTGLSSCAAGDIVQGAGTSPFTCTNVAAQSLVVAQGTGVVSGLAPGTVGNVPRDNGSSWSSSKPANSSYAVNSTTTSTATWATVTSLTVVVPTGATLSVHADENMDLPTACTGSTGIVGVMGIGIDSSTVATVTSLCSLSSLAYDSLIDDYKSLALNYGTASLSAGTHTVYLLTKNNSATCTITVNGDIVADVFP